jgi:hypothetical protein
VGQALTTEAIAECIRSGGVWETESNIDLLDLASTPAATDWDASFTVERIKLDPKILFDFFGPCPLSTRAIFAKHRLGFTLT